MIFGGLFFSLKYGIWAGMALATIILIILMNWGDKVVLVLLKARYIGDDENLVNHVKNLCCHLKVGNVKIYWSNVFVNNIYYTDSRFGAPSIIIGKNLYKELSRNELVSLLNASLMKIKNKEAQTKTLSSILFALLYSPVLTVVYLCRKTRMKSVTQVFLYPVLYLKSFCYEKEDAILAFDSKVTEFDGLKKEYLSAIFKISAKSEIFESTITSLIVNELTHIKNKNTDIISSTILNRVDTMVRIKNLNSH